MTSGERYTASSRRPIYPIYVNSRADFRFRQLRNASSGDLEAAGIYVSDSAETEMNGDWPGVSQLSDAVFSATKQYASVVEREQNKNKSVRQDSVTKESEAIVKQSQFALQVARQQPTVSNVMALI